MMMAFVARCGFITLPSRDIKNKPKAAKFSSLAAQLPDLRGSKDDNDSEWVPSPEYFAETEGLDCAVKSGLSLNTMTQRCSILKS